MATGVTLESHKLCVRRCVYAVLYSVCAQFALLTTFLLFVHFSPLHPLDWLYRTVADLLSPLTWLRLLPLLAAVVTHGLLLGKAQLAARPFHANRFTACTRTGTRQAALLAAHAVVGLLSAWLYAGHLPADYAHLYAECSDDAQRYCLNERYALLLLAGIYTAIYYFVRERCRQPVRFVRFPLLPQARYLEMRQRMHALLGEAVRRALLPTGAFALAAYVAGGLLTQNIALCLGLAREPAAGVWRAVEVLDAGQLLFMFVIGAQIIANMRLMDHLFNTFLTERITFAVEAPPPSALAVAGPAAVVTLVQALAADENPLLQELAALDLVALGERTAVAASRRQQVFALSVPGGHPYNWTALSGQCLALIDAFRSELKSDVELALKAEADGGRGASGAAAYLKGAAAQFGRGGATAMMTRSMPSLASETAGEMAAKLMMRQYNETYGIRNMTSPGGRQQQPEVKAADPCRRFNETIERVTFQWIRFKSAVVRLPGIHYLFGVDATARLAHLLTARCQPTGDTVHGLASLAVHSLQEDRYGVVQADLERIVHALLLLRAELERVDGVSFGAEYVGVAATATAADGGAQRRCAALRGTVKRSLGQLAAVFGEYLPDLLTDAGEIRTMEAFAQFRVT